MRTTSTNFAPFFALGRFRFAIGLSCVIALLAHRGYSAEQGGAEDTTPATRFLTLVSAHNGIEPGIKTLLRKTWDECEDCDEDEFLMQGLTLVSPAFRDLLDAYDADDHARCFNLADALRSDPEPFVSVNAAAFAVRSLVAIEKTEEAIGVLNTLFEENGRKLTAYSYAAPEMAFLRGYCAVANLQYSEAINLLDEFVTAYPNAPARFQVAAKQMLQELANREPEQMGEVVDLMNYSRARLAHSDCGELVQARQKRIVDILDKLIDETEQKEKQSSSSSSESEGNDQQNQGKDGSRNRKSSTPRQESVLPGGALPPGPLHAGRRANPAEAWGSMPPAERERILQAIRESFPSRYRRLVEQYYAELAKKP